jgi:prepilin-type N-terminal cleavage/methylation domain-containing protein
MKSQRTQQKGFSLVELSIAMVVLSLLVGGMLLGSNLIEGAAMRSQMQQIERYTIAFYNFQQRFDAFPGDMVDFTEYFDTATHPEVRNGDGDGMLHACNGWDATTGLCNQPYPAQYASLAKDWRRGEILQFWNHLSLVDLIPGYYNGCHADGSGSPANCGRVGESFPESPLGEGLIVYTPHEDEAATQGGGEMEKYYFQIGGTAVEGYYWKDAIVPTVTPAQAYAIDSKMDDGMAGIGSITARSSVSPDAWIDSNRTMYPPYDGQFLSTAPPTACVNENPSGVLYESQDLPKLSYALGNDKVSCTLRFEVK